MSKQTSTPDYRPAWEQASDPTSTGERVILAIVNLGILAVYGAIGSAIVIVILGVLAWSWRQW